MRAIFLVLFLIAVALAEEPLQIAERLANSNNNAHKSGLAAFEDDELTASNDIQMLGALFKDPQGVIESNEFIAPDRTSRHVFDSIDAQRDEYEQLYGLLSEPESADDCPKISAAGKKLSTLLYTSKTISRQIHRLPLVDREAIHHYYESKLASISHRVSSTIMKRMIDCEGGQRQYAETVTGIRLVKGKVEELRQEMFENEENCVKLQNIFHDFSSEIESFHRHASFHLAEMRSQNRLVAEGRAQLEISSRMAPTEREFYSTFHALWARNCRDKVDEALGLKEGEGSSSAASASGSGSEEKKLSSRVELLAASGGKRAGGGGGGRMQKLFALEQLADVASSTTAAASSGSSSSGSVSSTSVSSSGSTAASSSSSSGSTSSSSSSSSDANNNNNVPFFPHAYPRSVHLLLLVAAVGMSACAGIFIWMRSSASGDELIHTVVFLFTAIAAISYLALYTGVGVSTKIDAGENATRVILWARHVDLLVTLPLLSLALALFARADLPQIAGMMGASALMAFSWFIEASVVGSTKYVWWTISVVFYIILISQFALLLSSSRDRLSVLTSQTLQWLTALLAIVFAAFLTFGIIGSEGMGLISLTTEVGLFVFSDLISKVGFGFFLLGGVEETAIPSGESGRLLASARYV